MSRKPRYRMHGGFRMPLGFPPEGFDSGLRYRPAPGDLFVASYPKCGTTWLQYIVYLLTHGGEPLPRGASLSAAFPHLEEAGAEAVGALPAPRLIKTHLPLELTPWHDRARYLYIARNPFDCVVSFYHHTRGFVVHYDFADGTFDEFFECFIRGEVDFGDYFDHLTAWCGRSGADNVLFTTYEALKSDPRAVIAAVAAFIEPATGQAAREDLVIRVAAETRFERMRRDQERWSSRRPDGMPPFVRKGAVGDWKNHLSAAQAARLLRAFRARTRATPAEGLWPAIMSEAESVAKAAGERT